MFHLLVAYQGWPDSAGSLSTSRVYIKRDSKKDAAFFKGDQLDIDKIRRIPALLMSEIDGAGPQTARVAYITSVTQDSGRTVIQYMVDNSVPPISNSAFQLLAAQAGLTNLALSHTHWAIEEGDLFKMLLLNEQKSAMSPKVFSLGTGREIEGDLISVMMPFNAEFDDVYSALQDVTSAMSLRCVRADDFWEHHAIMQDIVTLLVRARIVICDCTGKNPNVFYEAGIAHTLGKEVILITQSASDVPFDLRHLRYVSYLNNREGRKELAVQVQARLTTLLAR